MPYVYNDKGERVFAEGVAVLSYLQNGWSITPPSVGRIDQGISRTLPEGFGSLVGNPEMLDKLRKAREALVHDFAASNPDLFNHRIKSMSFRGYSVDGQPLFTTVFEGDVVPSQDSYYDLGIPGANIPSDYAQQSARVVTLGMSSGGRPVFDQFSTGDQEITVGDFSGGSLPGGGMADRLARVGTALRQRTIERDEAIDRVRVITGLSDADAREFLAGAAVGALDPSLFPELSDEEAVAIYQSFGFEGETPEGGDIDPFQQFLDEFASMFSSGGGGPAYVAPDRGLIEDNIKGLLNTLVGRTDEGRVQTLTDLYLKDSRRAFDGHSVDPGQSVREHIRSFADYQVIHANRPDTIDEAEWITRQFTGLMNAGVRNSAIEDRARVQAQIGVTAARAGAASQLSEFQATGRPLPAFFDKFRNAATTSFRRVA